GRSEYRFTDGNNTVAGSRGCVGCIESGSAIDHRHHQVARAKWRFVRSIDHRIASATGATMIQPASMMMAAARPADDSLAASAKNLLTAKPDPKEAKLREAFNDFVGQTFYSQMLSAMR